MDLTDVIKNLCEYFIKSEERKKLSVRKIKANNWIIDAAYNNFFAN